MELLAENLNLILALIAAGAFAGIAAGLFGIGGGVVIVPALYGLFGAFGFDDDVRMKTAVATSLATIVITSWRSCRAHYKQGGVDVRVLKAWVPWIVSGALIGALIASQLPGKSLVLFFGGFIVLVALQLAFGSPDWRISNQLPEGWIKVFLANSIGISSAMVGIGGGVFGVLVMTLSGKPIHRAVGTAAGFGAANGLPAALIFMITGLLAGGTIPFSVGYVNIPGFVLIASLTAMLAPVGARLAHKLPAIGLRRLFAAILLLTGGIMIGDGLIF